MKRLNPEIQESLKIDDFIALDITFIYTAECDSSIIYWRTGDFKKSILEIGVSENDGKILSITLPLVNKVYKTLDKFSKGNIVKGSPCFFTDEVNDNGFYDYENEFKFKLTNKIIQLIFCDSDSIKLTVSNGRIDFGFTEQNLLAFIEIKELTQKEYDQINVTLNHLVDEDEGDSYGNITFENPSKFCIKVIETDDHD